MNHLKEENSDQWNLQALSYYFDQDECSWILQIKPGGAEAQSKFTWIYNNSGVYLVKSGYWLWSSSSLNHSLATEQKPNFSEIFKTIWTVGSSNKIRNFLWRCLTSSLTVGTELHKRKINRDASCCLCGTENEDVNHLLFQCDLAHEVWSLPQLAPIFAETGISSSLYQNLWLCITISASRTGTTLEDAHLAPWILWLIWKARNEFIFQRKTTSAMIIFQKAKSDATEWFQNSESRTPVTLQTRSNTSREKWEAPPLSYLKCNVDASWQDSHDRCGISWILRDNSGSVRLYGIKVYPRLLSSLEAEATALVWAVHCIWNMGYDRVIFETNSATLINALQSPSSWPRLSSFTIDIQGTVARRPWNVTFNHISRTRNEAADVLAKSALSLPLYFGSIDNLILQWLQPSLEC